MKRVILVVMDGWGEAPVGKGNYITQANKPNFDRLVKEYPHTLNEASGLAVGLPKGVQGNSEVGHLHMGAGRIVWQQFQLINNHIEDKSIYKNKALVNAMKHALKNKSKLHLLGMCSDEGVHSHTDHLIALLDMAKQQKIERVYIHFIADGRDVPEFSSQKYVDIIENAIHEKGIGKIGTMIGRYYAMDRDNNWDRIKIAYDLYTNGVGKKASSATDGVIQAYARGDKTDYYIQPTIIDQESIIEDKDSVIFFNFRTDRPRELTKAFIEKDFTQFKRDKKPKILYTTLTQYNKEFNCPYAYDEERIENNLGKVISDSGLKQLRMAETEKYGHVTFFFNSQIETPYKNEDRELIPSAKVPSYDQKPEMSAYEIADKAVEQINSKKYDFILINFANCDLVGHSAVKEAIIKCVEVVDECVGKVVEASLENGYTICLTADHGSAEDKLYPDGKPKPAHSSNPVPFILVDKDLQKAHLRKGGQIDVAPTIIGLMGLKKPKEMTGKSLIEN